MQCSVQCTRRVIFYLCFVRACRFRAVRAECLRGVVGLCQDVVRQGQGEAEGETGRQGGRQQLPGVSQGPPQATSLVGRGQVGVWSQVGGGALPSQQDHWEGQVGTVDN